MPASEALRELLAIMARLRDPERGCSWDLAQNFTSLADATIEEAYELVDAIEGLEPERIREELGDFLFQAVFYARLAEEQGWFNLNDVIMELTAKLVRRHPHVFDNPGGARLDPRQAKESWQRVKQMERRTPGLGQDRQQPFAGVPQSLPALLRTAKLLERSGERPVFDQEHIRRLEKGLAELAAAKDKEQALGALLLDCVRAAKALGVDAESALRRSGREYEAKNRLE